mgnify:CR=1 FL=1
MPENNKQKVAIIIGAGPAGLTAAYELLKRTDIKPIIIEKSDYMGGISRTVNYKGNRIDIGGHRFFSKSDRVMNWWFNILPPENMSKEDQTLAYQGKNRKLVVLSTGLNPENDDEVMLVRQRKSRIYFLRRFLVYSYFICVYLGVNKGILSIQLFILFFPAFRHRKLYI